MSAARLEMLAPYPSPAPPCCSRSSRFVSSVGRGLAAVPTSSFSSASSKKDSLQLKETAPPHSKGRLFAMLESGIWRNFSADTSCYGGALETIEKDVDKLELVLVQSEEDLNLSKQREVELTQLLEKERLHSKDLNRELKENTRAVRAELALRQAEKDIMDLSRELTLLKKGIQSRDEVIKLMEEKIEGNIHILRNASDDREAMRKMQAHIQNLESKLKEFISTP